MKPPSLKSAQVPNFVVHYSRGTPFLSMTRVPRDKWPQVIKDLSEENSWGVSRFSDPDYLARRFDAENLIRKEFIGKGGKPALQNPIYFFLGRHSRFEEHEMNQGYMIALKDLEPDSISFTYGDSLLSYNEDYRLHAGEKYRSSLCANIFLIKDLEDLFLHSEFPKDSPLNIEAQLWVAPPEGIVQKLG